MFDIFILGTSHRYQAPKTLDEQAHAKQFRFLLQVLCDKYKIKGIAEEMSEEALQERTLDCSVPFELAQSQKLLHRYCDPDRSERDALGILQDTTVEINGWASNLSRLEIQKCIAEHHRRREEVWLERLSKFDAFPVLFVCGADHVDSFVSLLERESITVSVVERNWEPARLGNNES